MEQRRVVGFAVVVAVAVAALAVVASEVALAIVKHCLRIRCFAAVVAEIVGTNSHLDHHTQPIPCYRQSQYYFPN